MESRVKSDLNFSPLIEMLKVYKDCPNPSREMWAERNWQNLQLFADKTKDLPTENKTKKLCKGKGLVWHC